MTSPSPSLVAAGGDGPASSSSSSSSRRAGSSHPIYGTTIYIGRNELETDVGPFTVFTYQDLIHKGYVLALVKGDIERDGNGIVYTRLHSSCVTSGTATARVQDPTP